MAALKYWLTDGYAGILRNPVLSKGADPAILVDTTLPMSAFNSPSICRMSMFKLLLTLNEPVAVTGVRLYQEAKDAALEYREAKGWLHAPGGPLWGWVVSPEDRDIASLSPPQC